MKRTLSIIMIAAMLMSACIGFAFPAGAATTAPSGQLWEGETDLLGSISENTTTVVPAGLALQSTTATWVASSGGAFLWQPTTSGVSISFKLNVKTEGEKTAYVRVGNAADYGKITLMWDGTQIGNEIDMYAATAEADLVNLGALNVTAGEHTLTVKVIGKNEANTAEKYFVSIDYFELVGSDNKSRAVTPDTVGNDYRRVTKFDDGRIRYEAETLTIKSQETGLDIQNQMTGNINCLLSYVEQVQLLGFAGAWVNYEFEVYEDGEYSTLVHFTMAKEFGICTVEIDGKEIIGSTDTYSASVSSIYKNGTNVMLSKGKHVFTVKIEGKNQGTQPGTVSIDYLEICKVGDYTAPAVTPEPTVEAPKLYNGQIIDDYELYANLAKNTSGVMLNPSRKYAVINPILQDISQDTTSSYGTHIFWLPVTVGSELGFNINIRTEGEKNVKIKVTKAKDYGIMEVLFDGVKVGSDLDLYNASVTYDNIIDLGKLNVTPGEHMITFRTVGKNEASTGYGMAVDYIELLGEGDTSRAVNAASQGDNYKKVTTLENGNIIQYEGQGLTIVTDAAAAGYTISETKYLKNFGSFTFGTYFRCNGTKVGDTVTFTFNVPANGKYAIKFANPTATEFASLSYTIDDTVIVENTGCMYNLKNYPGVVTNGVMMLTEGTHTLTISVLALGRDGKNANIAFDYMQLEKIGDYVDPSAPVEPENPGTSDAMIAVCVAVAIVSAFGIAIVTSKVRASVK